ncbi:MAG: cytochrome ubiquinol oxidase subunit II family protein [Acidiferrobacteraceae bacterium]
MTSSCSAEAYLSFLNPGGPIAAAQRWHFYWVLGIMAVLVAGPIFLLLPVFLWRYRYGAKSSRYMPRWKTFLPLEIAFWVGPIIIVVVLAFFVWRDSHALDPYKPIVSNTPALQVQVIGYDWKWLFIYPDQGIASIGTMAMPVGRPLAMHLTSATVMQSFFIPALGSQIYAMGGMVTQLNLEASKPGRFLGENTQYNGNGFHQQQFTAVAMTPGGFRAWVQKVRANGIPLDASTYKTLSQRSTLAQVVAALQKAKPNDCNVYLKDVPQTLFPAVVEATKNDTQVSLGHASMSPAKGLAIASRTLAVPAKVKVP